MPASWFLLKSLLGSFDYFVKSSNVDRSVLSTHVRMYYRVKFSQNFSQFGIEVVLDAVVRSIWKR